MPSFDIVSKVQMHEVDNAVQQASNEVATRYDFRDSDTTLDCDQRLETGNAFLAESTDSAGMLSAAQRALAAYSLTQPFDRLRRRAMRVDSSWERSSRRYEYLYRNLR